MGAILPVQQPVFIEGKLHGSAARGGRADVNQHGDGPIGYAFFCPDSACGRTWALAPVAGRPFQVWTRFCSRHRGRSQDTGGVAGSLTLTWDEKWNQALPLEVLRRELELEIDHIEFLEKHSEQ